MEGGKGGEFAWRDGPLLAALKAGHWIVLDEVSSTLYRTENGFSVILPPLFKKRIRSAGVLAPNVILYLKQKL